jgi:hypothetical protein
MGRATNVTRRRLLVVVGSTVAVMAVLAVIAMLGANSAKPMGDRRIAVAVGAQ